MARVNSGIDEMNIALDNAKAEKKHLEKKLADVEDRIIKHEKAIVRLDRLLIKMCYDEDEDESIKDGLKKSTMMYKTLDKLIKEMNTLREKIKINNHLLDVIIDYNNHYIYSG